MKRHGTRSLGFPLEVEDDWPPVAVEWLPFEVIPGGLRLQAIPLFVKALSMGDLITVRARNELVSSWKHRDRSDHTTIWLMETGRGAKQQIKRALQQLRDLGCSTSHADEMVVYAIDVPPETSMKSIDAALSTLDAAKVAVAYPSFRHTEAGG